ncbi:MAG: DUF433 domain-containing protein [Leptolyngbyaceae cyanobacterium SU_3_3]|nr:DUF433 domain-containing protein [Leptolyngbyaceae cyanobacterium SU_3_3]
MPALTDIGTLITMTPGVYGGRPCIAGIRITVQYIITEIKAEVTPEEILEDKPFLSLASIHAAIAYYYANKASLDVSFAAQTQENSQWEQQTTTTTHQPMATTPH